MAQTIPAAPGRWFVENGNPMLYDRLQIAVADRYHRLYSGFCDCRSVGTYYKIIWRGKLYTQYRNHIYCTGDWPWNYSAYLRRNDNNGNKG